MLSCGSDPEENLLRAVVDTRTSVLLPLLKESHPILFKKIDLFTRHSLPVKQKTLASAHGKA